MTLFRCTIPGKPIPQGRQRVPRFGRPYYPKTSQEHRALLVAAFQAVPKGTRSISLPCELEVGVAGARKNSDLSNHAKAVEDALVDAGVLVDDNLSIVCKLTLEALTGEPRTEVTIRSYP